MFNSDSTGDVRSQLRQPRIARPAGPSSVQDDAGGQGSDKTRRRQGARSKAVKPKLTPRQLEMIKEIRLGEVLKTKLVEKSQQLQSRTQDFASVDHLSSDAAAMFIDNELSRGAMHRARLHLVHCSECRQEITRQRDTVDFVRTECRNDNVTAPSDLKAKLMSLANECDPGPGAEDVAIQRPESFVAKVESVVRAVRRTQGR